jgi:hypothetical protein
MRKSSSDMWMNSGLPAHSPRAQTSGRARVQPLVDANVTATVQLDADFAEADPGGVRNAPRGNEDVAAPDVLLAGARADVEAHFLSGLTAHTEELGRHMNLDPFVFENPLHLVRDVEVLPSHELRPGFDNCHLAAEATVGLGQFKAGIAAPDHDQIRRQIIELQDLDVRQRLGDFEAGNARNRSMRSNVEEDLGASQRPRPSVIEADLDSLRRDEAPSPHDQIGAALLVVLQMRSDLRFDHFALALANRRHVDLDGTGDRAELCGVARQMRDLGASNLVLGGHARDVGTGAADPSALHDSGPPPRPRHMPSHQLACRSTAEDQHVELFGLRHGWLPF